MLARYPLVALLVALAVAMPGGAEHCTTWSTSEPEVDISAVSDVTYIAYVDNDLCQPECIFSVWLYCESNGIEGLQRGDEVRDDTCHGMIESDSCGLG